jgi:putative sporulation protein YtxC
VNSVLLKLIVCDKENDDVIKELKDIRDNFKIKDVKIGIVERLEQKTHFIKVFCDDKEYGERLKDKFNLYLSIALYKIIAKEFCIKELNGFLDENYFFLQDAEIEDIKTLCIDALLFEGEIKDESRVYYINRRNLISQKIIECIKENDEINIKGLIRFRIKEFEKDFFSIVDKVIEKYMSEKEYVEFIKLLKYFIEIQESKVEEVNV